MKFTFQIHARILVVEWFVGWRTRQVSRTVGADSERYLNFTQMEDETVDSPYADWIKQPVLLRVKVEDFRTALRGIILSESQGSLQFRLWKGRRNLRIQKSTVLAVEQDPHFQSQKGSRKPQLATYWRMPLAS